MWRELTTLWQSICDPEYLHLLLEPLPLYGLGIGLTFLIVAFLFVLLNLLADLLNAYLDPRIRIV